MWNKPIVDFRTDAIVRGTLPKYVALTERLGLPPLVRHLGRPLAYYVADVGILNRVSHLWEFDSYNDLELRRAALANDPEWGKYMEASAEVIVEQSSRITRQVRFPNVADGLRASVHTKPVVDFRIYTLKRNRVSDFLDATEKYCMPVQLKHIGPPLGYYITEIGPLDSVTHLWGYDSLADMEARRTARTRDSEWPKYVETSNGIFVSQDTSVVRRLALNMLAP